MWFLDLADLSASLFTFSDFSKKIMNTTLMGRIIETIVIEC